VCVSVCVCVCVCMCVCVCVFTCPYKRVGAQNAQLRGCSYVQVHCTLHTYTEPISPLPPLQVLPSPSFNPEETVRVQLDACAQNDEPWANHGIQTMYEYCGGYLNRYWRMLVPNKCWRMLLQCCFFYLQHSYQPGCVFACLGGTRQRHAPSRGQAQVPPLPQHGNKRRCVGAPASCCQPSPARCRPSAATAALLPSRIALNELPQRLLLLLLLK